MLKNFQNKQSLNPFDTPYTCHPLPELRTVAFRLPDLCRLLFDLSDHGDVDPSGVFPLFLKKVAKLIARPLAAIFSCLLHLCSFPACWQNVRITPIPNGHVSSISAEYWPISITSVLSKVYERLVVSKFRRFFES